MLLLRICTRRGTVSITKAILTSTSKIVLRVPTTSQERFYAAPKSRIKGPMLTMDQQEDYVEEDAAKLCTHVCINYHTDVEGHGPEIKAHSEYPEWLFKLDLEPDKDVEDLDPEKDGWKYWEKWEQRRQDQILLHNKLKYKNFWLQDSPSVQMALPHNKYKNTDKGHKFHLVPNTCGGVYMKATRQKRLNVRPWRRWSSLEEPELLLEKNG